MSYDLRYERRKNLILNDKKICKENRDIFKEFFEWEEHKLKRIRNLRQLDEGCYKTLFHYIAYFYNVNKWFNNKAWNKLTKKEIQKVYDDLEDGKIKKFNGTPFQDRNTYYNKIFKSKPFALADKDGIAKEVMEFYRADDYREVNYVEFEDFKKLINVAITPKHKLLLWLLWDIGENIFSILQLKKRNFVRQINKDTKEFEYNVNLPREILKRNRVPRTETTNFKETTELLDIILENLKDDDLIFNFGYRQAEKIFDRAVKITNIKCKPTGKKPSIKDLRSGTMCDLLDKGWSRDEINARLGHKPSSTEIDKYINYKALDKQKPKIKVYQNNLAKIEIELEEVKQREKLKEMRFEELKKEYDLFKHEVRKHIEERKKQINIEEYYKNEIMKGFRKINLESKKTLNYARELEEKAREVVKKHKRKKV